MRTHAARKSRKTLLLAAVGLTLVAAALAATLVPTAGADPPLPHNVVAIGDSMTSGWGSGIGTSNGAANVPGDNLAGSWATGSNPAVRSHVQRLAALGATVTSLNLALPGRKTTSPDGIVWQASQVPVGTDAVLVEVGSADLCASDVTAPGLLNSPATFEAQLDAALREIDARLPDAHVLIASIPDWYRLWQMLPALPRPVGTCPLLFSADPTIANTASRLAVRQRIVDYNAAIVRVCARFGTCRSDGGAVNALVFSQADLSTVDFFHFSTQGQAKLASATWPAGWYAGTGPARVTVVHENADYTTLAVDRSGAAYGLSTLADDTAGPNRIYRSTDEGRNWTVAGDLPAGDAVVALSTIASGTLFAHVIGPDGFLLYRSTDSGHNWARSFTFPDGYQTLTPHSIADSVAADGRSVYIASYIPGPNADNGVNYVWRSDDDGRSWSVVHQTTTHRHAHFVVVNPYDGAIYVGYGDSDAQSAIERSTDRGVTWNVVCAGSQCTAVDIAFDSSGFAVFGQDRPQGDARMVRLDLATGTPISLGGMPGPSYSSITLGGGRWLLGETHEADMVDDGSVHLFASDDGARSFSDVLTRPVADPTADQRLMVQFAYANGDFPVQVWGYGTIVARFGAGSSAPEWRASPAVTGDARQGATLAATTGDWGGNPSGFTYQWSRCDATRSLCTDIPGGTAATYSPVAADVGGTLRVRVTAQSSGGASVATSLATPPVAAAVAAPDFALTLGEVTVRAGGKAFKTSVIVTATGGFDDPVRLQVADLPRGVHAAIVPGQVHGSGRALLVGLLDARARRSAVTITVTATAGAHVHQASLVLVAG